MASMPSQTPLRPSAAASSSALPTATPFKTPSRTPGREQTSQTPIVDFAQIERQKENVAPTSRGRSAFSLSQTLGLKHREKLAELDRKRREFEAKLADSAYMQQSNDPLKVWEDYVDWIKEAYPSGGSSADSGLVSILERATRAFVDEERHRQDERYLRLWIQYAQSIEAPELVLNWLLANEVGTELADLYEEMASSAEAQGLYESADSLYKLGISRSAQPLNSLSRSYKRFQERIVRNQSEPSSSDADAGQPMSYSRALARAMRDSKRVLLGSKDERTGKSFDANSMRGNARSGGLTSLGPSVAATTNNGRKIAVFRDTDGSKADGNGKGPQMGDLGSRDARRQENVKEAKAWTGERLPQKVATTPGGKNTLRVFQDSDDEDGEDGSRSPSKSTGPNKPMLGSQPSESDLLKKDPFRKWNNKVQTDAAALRGVELGDASLIPTAKSSSSGSDKTAPPQVASSSSTSRSADKVASQSSSSAKASSSSKKSTSTKRSSSSKPSSSSRPSSSTAAAVKRVEQHGFCNAILRPIMTTDSHGVSFPGSYAYSIDEVLAMQRGLQVSGDVDPWAYLDMVEPPKQDEPASIESDEEQEGSSTPVRAVAPDIDRQSSLTPTQASQSTSKPVIAQAEAKPKPSSSRIHAEPTVTMMTRAAQDEVRALFNGEDDDSDASSASAETSSDEEDDDHCGVPPTPTPLQRIVPQLAANDENAAVGATPARSAPTPLALKSRTALGALPTATPIRRPLGASGGSLGPLAKKPIFVEEDEEDEEEARERSQPPSSDGQSRSGPQRITAEDSASDEESDADSNDGRAAADGRDYNYQDGQDLLQGGARYSELTTIAEQTEFPTRWGMNTPGRSKSIVRPDEPEDEDVEDEGQGQASNILPPPSSQAAPEEEDKSFASDSDSQLTPAAITLSDPSRFGGKASFNMSPGYTIARGEVDTGRWEDNSAQSSVVHDIAAFTIAEASSSSPLSTIPNPCCPTDLPVIEAILRSLSLPIESSPDYIDRTTSDSAQLANLKKRAKAQARKSTSGNTSVVVRPNDWTLSIDGHPFAVREMLGEGAYGSVFLAEDVEDSVPATRPKAHLGGINGDSSFDCSTPDEEEEEVDEDEAERRRMVAIKVESPPNKWEFYILGQLRARLEARALQSIISARRFFAYKDESLLLLEWGEKGTLLEIVNHASAAGVAPTTGVSMNGGAGAATGVEEVLAMFFSIELLRLVEALHSRQLIHGDLKIDNVLLRLEEPEEDVVWSTKYNRSGSDGWSCKGVHLLDFGRAIDLSVFSKQDQEQQFVADWETDHRDCYEMRKGLPWNYQVDYHGIAAVAHVLLFGKYLEVTDGERVKLQGSMKRWWQGDLWSRFFDLLLNSKTSSDGSWPMTNQLTSLRGEMEDWLEENGNKGGKNLKGLLKKLEIWAMKRRG